ncbi:MAG: hypothetical protein OEM97_09020 [Acidimicrobiia bacterium]|nr:hypothetical protein [Acidimicrobiia bacterium]
MFRHKILIPFAALSLIMAACGGGAADETTTTPPQATATTSGATATTAGPTTTAPPQAATTSVAPPTTSGNTGGGAALSAFRAAASDTAQVDSAQMEGSFTITGAEGMPADQPLTMAFSGGFDNVTGDFSMIIDLGGMMEAALATGEDIPPEFADLFSAMEMRQVGDTAYIRFPFFNMFLGIETEWLSVPAEDAGGVGDFTGGFVPTNPSDFLSEFGDVDATIEDLGPDTVRGVSTTHYRATVDAATLAEDSSDALSSIGTQDLSGLEKLPIDFWVGNDGLLYKFEMTIDGASVQAVPGEGFDSMVMSFEFFGYNEPITVVAPDPADVTDAEDVGAGIFGDF